MTNEAGGEQWLLISVSTAGAAGTLRVQVWRKLRSLGALYVQQSVCLLPERPKTTREVHRLVDRVHRQPLILHTIHHQILALSGRQFLEHSQP